MNGNDNETKISFFQDNFYLVLFVNNVNQNYKIKYFIRKIIFYIVNNV